MAHKLESFAECSFILQIPLMYSIFYYCNSILLALLILKKRPVKCEVHERSCCKQCTTLPLKWNQEQRHEKTSFRIEKMHDSQGLLGMHDMQKYIAHMVSQYQLTFQQIFVCGVLNDWRAGFFPLDNSCKLNRITNKLHHRCVLFLKLDKE